MSRGKFSGITEKAVCPYCQDMYDKEEMTFGICPDCIKSNANLFNAIELGAENKENILLNGFFASLGTEVIEKLLSKALQEDYILEMLELKGKEYCLEDQICFADFLRAEAEDYETKRRKQNLSYGPGIKQVQAV